jgi:hypothetical protein
VCPYFEKSVNTDKTMPWARHVLPIDQMIVFVRHTYQRDNE